MENKGEVINKPMSHRDEKPKPYRSRKDITALLVTYCLLVVMFGVGLILEVYGAITGRMDFSGIVLISCLVPILIFVILAILEARKIKR